jgi:protein-tyrosine phosphatase
MSITSRAKARALKIKQSLDSPFDTILPFLCLGANPSKEATTMPSLDAYLHHHKFTHRIDCTANPQHNSDIPTCYVTVKDSPDATAKLFQHLPGVCDFIDEAKRTSRCKILIHCQAGVSRSATVVLYYLLARGNMNLSLAQALRVVRDARPIVSPNPGFMRGLCQVETKLGGTPSIDPQAYQKHRHGKASKYIVLYR